MAALLESLDLDIKLCRQNAKALLTSGLRYRSFCSGVNRQGGNVQYVRGNAMIIALA